MTKHKIPHVLGGKSVSILLTACFKRLPLVLCIALLFPQAATYASPVARTTATSLPAVTAPICSLCTAQGHCDCGKATQAARSGECGAGFLSYFMSQQDSVEKCLECAANTQMPAMDWRSGHNEVDLLIIRLTACINRQNLGGVVKTAEELGRRGVGSPNYYYEAARGYAMIVSPPPSTALNPDEKSVVVKTPAAAEEIAAPAPEAVAAAQKAAEAARQKKQRQQASFTQRAIHFLQQAERMGYFDSPARVEQLHDDTAFKSLRQEPTFVRFLQLISPKTGMPPMPGDDLPAGPPEMIPVE